MTFSLQEIKLYEVGVTSSGITFVPNLVKIRPLFQKLEEADRVVSYKPNFLRKVQWAKNEVLLQVAYPDVRR
jgi:hypothetical protein